jgi:putative peptidoglycan lipid II flippase
VYLAGAFPFAASTIVMRNYYAVQNTMFPMLISTIIAVLSIPCYLVFSKSMGAQGIALTASMAMFIQFAVLYWMWSSRNANLPGFFKVVFTLVKVVVISGCGGGCTIAMKLFLMRHGLPGENFYQNILLAAGAGIPALCIAFIALEAAHIGNTREMLKRLFSRVKA